MNRHTYDYHTTLALAAVEVVKTAQKACKLRHIRHTCGWQSHCPSCSSSVHPGNLGHLCTARAAVAAGTKAAEAVVMAAVAVAAAVEVAETAVEVARRRLNFQAPL